MAIAAELGRPMTRRRALDFGCGMGRLTIALGGRFGEAVGVDISEPMIRGASALPSGRDGHRERLI